MADPMIIRRSRAGHRAVATKRVKSVTALLTTHDPDVVILEQLKRGLKDTMETLKRLDDELLPLIDPGEIENEIDESSVIQDNILGAIVRIDGALSPRSRGHSPPVVAPSPVGTHSSVTAKLPKLTLKHFNGSRTGWSTFWDSYRSAIHDNASLSNVDKFTYLQSLLEGRAKDAISGLAITDANYSIAIDLLTQRFGDKERAVKNWFTGTFYNNSSNSWGVAYASQTSFNSNIAQLANAKLIVTTGGSVGVGTTAPDTLFHVKHANNNVVGKFESGDNQVWINLNDNGGGTYGALLGHDSDAGHMFAIADNSVTKRFVIDGSGNVGIGVTSVGARLHVNSGSANRVAKFISSDATAYIQVADDSTTATTHGYGATANALSLFANDSEAIRIDSSQRVGIGTTSPSDKVEVYANGADVALKIHEDAGTHSARLHLREGTQDTYIQNRAGNGFEIRTEGNISTSNTPAMQINSAGNVTAGYDLTVTGDLTVNGTTTTINTTDLNVEDKNITLNYSTGDSSASANGAGITIQDAVNSTTDATILWEAIDNRFDFSNHIGLPDDKRIKLGDNQDLQIFHNSTNNHSVITESGSGDLRLSADDLYIKNAAATENKAVFLSDGAVKLYYNDAEKIKTTSTGIDVTGTAVVDGLTSSGIATVDELSVTNDATFNGSIDVGGGTIDCGAITSIGNSRFNGDFQVGDTLNQNAFGALQVNQTSNVDEEGIAVLAAAGGRSIRIWVDETNSYINSGNGGSGNLIFNEAITVSSGGNLTGVGTINSGSITTSGNIVFDDGQITSSNNEFIFDGADAKEVIIKSARDVRIIIDDNNDDSTNEFEVFKHNDDNATNKILNLTQAGVLTIANNINTTAGDYQINETTVINSSKELRNIEAIRIQTTEIMDNTRLLKNITGIELAGDNRQIKFLGDGGPFGLEFGDTEANPNFRLYYRTTPNTLTFENNASSAKHTFDLDGNYTATNDITSGDNVIVGRLLIMGGGVANAISFTGTGTDTNVRNFAYEASGHHYVTNRHTNGDLVLMSNNGTGGSETARMTLQAGSGTQDIDITNANLDLNSNNITSVGTIGSGAISTSGQLQITTASGLGSDGGIYFRESGQQIHRIYPDNNNQYNSIGSSDPIWHWLQQGGDTNAILKDSGFDLKQGAYKVNGTTAIDASLNLSNIVAISNSGTITSTGSDHTFYSGGSTQSLAVGRLANQSIKIEVTDNNNIIQAFQDSDGNGNHYFDLRRDFDGTGSNLFRIRKGTTTQIEVDGDGDLNVANGDLKMNGQVVITNARALTNIGTITSGFISASTGDASSIPLSIGSGSNTNYTLQRWITSAHSGNTAYMIAYGASHGSQANHFAMKNVKSGGEIFFELFGVEPLRLTSTGATFAGVVTAPNFTSNGDITISEPTPKLRLTDTDTGADSDISGSSSNGSLFLSADTNNEVANTVLAFQVDGATKAYIGTDGLYTQSGANSSKILDNSTRNLTNIGTISSGTITSTGQININGTTGLYLYAANGTTFRAAFHDDGTRTRLFADGNGSNPHMTFNGGNVGVGLTGTNHPSARLHVQGSGATVTSLVECTDGNQASLDLKNSEGHYRIITNGGELQIYDQTDSRQPFTIDTGGTTTLKGGTADTSDHTLIVRNSSNTSLFSIRNDGRIDVGGSQLLDSSRNFSNIGTITQTTNGTILDSSANLTNINNVYASGYRIGSTQIVDSSRNLININSLSVAGYIYHTGDTNTNIQFGTDTIQLNTGGSLRFQANNSSATVLGIPLIVSAPNSAEMQFKQTTGSTTASKGSVQWFDSGGNSCGTINLKANGSENNSGVMEFYVTAESDELGDDPFGINKMMTITENGVQVHGSLSKSSGSFRIDHPLKPETHDLVHSFVEGPQADNLYRGVIDLHNGRATIDLDEWFGMTPGTFLALNRDIQAFVNNADTWDNVRAKVMGSQLVIECQNPESNAKVSWLVIGERQDKEIYESTLTDDNGKVIVEPQKVG